MCAFSLLLALSVLLSEDASLHVTTMTDVYNSSSIDSYSDHCT